MYAHVMATEGVTVDSWTRNASWVNKFVAYAKQNCPDHLRARGMRGAIESDSLAMAFLAHVHSQDKLAKTRVDSAKRAINLLRSLVDLPSLDTNSTINLFSKAAKASVVAAARQAPAIPPPFLAAIIKIWGRSSCWWKRQVATMCLCAFCVLARGAGINECLRRGVVWVRHDGTVIHKLGNTRVHAHKSRRNCGKPGCVRGFLLLLPFRKNKQNVPSWIPVSMRYAVNLMQQHEQWLNSTASTSPYLFIARQNAREGGKRVYTPNLTTTSQMSVQSFRSLLRQAVYECCNVTKPLAMEFGTHSNRVAAVELLRQNGVPAELRQQLGDWMTQGTALHYMQLTPASQFDILDNL